MPKPKKNALQEYYQKRYRDCIAAAMREVDKEIGGAFKLLRKRLIEEEKNKWKNK
jgi:uncharacterized protein YecT (DUF1311 family)